MSASHGIVPLVATVVGYFVGIGIVLIGRQISYQVERATLWDVYRHKLNKVTDLGAGDNLQ